MGCADRLAVNHRQPVQRNLAGCHPGRIHIPWIYPKAEFQAHAVNCIRQVLEAVWKFLFVFLITAKAQSPVVHTRNDRCALVPGCIVIKHVKPHSLRETKFLNKLFFTVSFRQPYAISDQWRIWQRRLENISFQILERLIAGIVAVTPGKGEEADGRFHGRAWH